MEVNVHALLFADRVITENNGKKGVIGIFDRFTFSSFPATSPPWFIFFVMDNLSEGRHEFTINLARDPSEEVVFSAAGELNINDPSAGVTLAMPIKPLTFPREGTYCLSVLIEGRRVANRNLTIAPRPIKVEE